MSIILGNDTINKVYVGANPVLKIYKGSLLVVDFDDNSSSSSGSSASSESSGSSEMLLEEWVQLGQKINGRAPSNSSGSAVDINDAGTIIAVGEPLDDSSSTNAGLVKIYELMNNSWTQKGTNIVGAAFGDQCGRSLSLNSNGDIIAISSIYNDTGGTNIGYVRIFGWNGSNWSQIGSSINGETASDLSGWSISLNSTGNLIAIGTPNNDGVGNNAGHVRLYFWNGVSWIQLGSDIDGDLAEDQSGFSVSLSRNSTNTDAIVAIGARYNDGGSSNAGSVKIYRWNNNSWTQRGSTIYGEAADDNSGFSVSINETGNIIAIGAVSNDGSAFNGGSTRAYMWDGTSWIKMGADIDGLVSSGMSGYSVSLSNDGYTLAIGEKNQDTNGNDSGNVRVFIWDNNNWVQKGNNIPGENPLDFSGHSVSLNNNGNIIVIGAPQSIPQLGYVKVYNFI